MDPGTARAARDARRAPGDPAGCADLPTFRPTDVHAAPRVGGGFGLPEPGSDQDETLEAQRDQEVAA